MSILKQRRIRKCQHINDLHVYAFHAVLRCRIQAVLKKYCTECAKERHRKNRREYMRNIRNSGEYISPANEIRQARSNSMKRINDIARNTVNYGEYQAKRMED